MLERGCECPAVLAEKSDADLRGADEYHARRSPIVDDVGEQVTIHEQTIGLACEYRPPAPIGMAQPKRRLPRIHADAVEIELELRLVVLAAQLTAGCRTQARLANADDRLTVAAELAFGRRYLRWPQGGIPARIDPVEILHDVDLGEAVKLERDVVAVAGGFFRARGLRHLWLRRRWRNAEL